MAAEAALEPSPAVLALETMEHTEADEIRDELASLVERQPFALWQSHGDLFVVSDDGTVIQRYDDERYASLPLVVGQGAAAKASEFTKLLEAAPSLRPHVRAA